MIQNINEMKMLSICVKQENKLNEIPISDISFNRISIELTPKISITFFENI